MHHSLFTSQNVEERFRSLPDNTKSHFHVLWVLWLQESLHLPGSDVQACVNESKQVFGAERMKAQLARALLAGPDDSHRTFTVVAAGSSVTAGALHFVHLRCRSCQC